MKPHPPPTYTILKITLRDTQDVFLLLILTSERVLFLAMRLMTEQSVLQIGGGRNSHEAVLKVSEMVIRESRTTRVQPFNEYRKKFNLKPYATFHEFTGELKKKKICVCVFK